MVSGLSPLIISKSSSWAGEISLGSSRDVAELSHQWKQALLSALKPFFKYLRLQLWRASLGFSFYEEERQKASLPIEVSKALALLNHKQCSVRSLVDICAIITFWHSAISLATFACEDHGH